MNRLAAFAVSAVVAPTLTFGARPPAAVAAASTCVTAQLASSAYPVVLVKARVNGQGPYTFFVDTGATVSIIGASLARKLNLKLLPIPVQGVGAGGRFSTQASMASIAVGDVHQDRVLVATFDLAQISSAVGPVDGALGYDFLKAYRITIDYPGRRFCLEQP